MAIRNWDGAMRCDPTHSSKLRRASWLTFDAAVGAGWPVLTSSTARACLAPRSSRLSVEQVPVSTTQWRAATVERRARAVRDRRWWLGGRISRGRRSHDRVRVGCACVDQIGGFCHYEWPNACVSERREKAKGRVRRRRDIEIAGCV